MSNTGSGNKWNRMKLKCQENVFAQGVAHVVRHIFL